MSAKPTNVYLLLRALFSCGVIKEQMSFTEWLNLSFARTAEIGPLVPLLLTSEFVDITTAVLSGFLPKIKHS